MCLENFERFEQIKKIHAITGYRSWWLNIKDENSFLKSDSRNFFWDNKIIKADKVVEKDSGLYSYNNNNYYYNYNNYYNNNNNNYNNNNNNYNNYNNYNYNNNYYYNYNCNNYNIIGIIKQYGKVAIHLSGYRSQYAIIDTLFTIRKLDAKESQEFLDWIDKFNARIEKLAKFYDCKVVSWQDFLDEKNNKKILE